MRSMLILCVLGLLCGPAEAAKCRRVSRCANVCQTVTPCHCPVTAPAPVEIKTYSRSVHSQIVRECDGTTCRERTVTVNRSTCQGLAEKLAQKDHGVSQSDHSGMNVYEGIGQGSTPQEAISKCCHQGRTPTDIGTAQGVSGRWYAVIHYR